MVLPILFRIKKWTHLGYVIWFLKKLSHPNVPFCSLSSKINQMKSWSKKSSRQSMSTRKYNYLAYFSNVMEKISSLNLNSQVIWCHLISDFKILIRNFNTFISILKSITCYVCIILNQLRKSVSVWLILTYFNSFWLILTHFDSYWLILTILDSFAKCFKSS